MMPASGNRLDRSLCATRAIKRLKADPNRPKPPPLPEGVFQGEIHIVNLAFTWAPSVNYPGGTWSMNPEQAAVILDFTSRAVPLLVRYTRQYSRSIRATVDPLLGTGTLACAQQANSARSGYSDAQLAAWIDSYAAAQKLPPGDAVKVFSPPEYVGVDNTDAPVTGFIGGYHSVTPAGRPYSFTNFEVHGGRSLPLALYDAGQNYAQNSSHEDAEMMVDPQAAGPLDSAPNPEVCDECAANCGDNASNYFDLSNQYVAPPPGTGLGPGFLPQPAGTAYYIAAVVRPAYVADCPPADSVLACCYPPP